MQPSVALLRTLAALDDDFILVELLLFDGYIDLDDVLPDDAPSTNIQVASPSTESIAPYTEWMMHLPDLRVAHEPIAETDRQTVRMKGSCTVFFRDRVHVRRISSRNGVTLHIGLRCNAPSIVDAMVRREHLCAGRRDECGDLHEADLVLDLDHVGGSSGGGCMRAGRRCAALRAAWDVQRSVWAVTQVHTPTPPHWPHCDLIDRQCRSRP